MAIKNDGHHPCSDTDTWRNPYVWCLKPPLNPYIEPTPSPFQNVDLCSKQLTLLDEAKSCWRRENIFFQIGGFIKKIRWFSEDLMGFGGDFGGCTRRIICCSISNPRRLPTILGWTCVAIFRQRLQTDQALNKCQNQYKHMRKAIQNSNTKGEQRCFQTKDSKSKVQRGPQPVFPAPMMWFCTPHGCYPILRSHKNSQRKVSKIMVKNIPYGISQYLSQDLPFNLSISKLFKSHWNHPLFRGLKSPSPSDGETHRNSPWVPQWECPPRACCLAPDSTSWVS